MTPTEQINLLREAVYNMLQDGFIKIGGWRFELEKVLAATPIAADPEAAPVGNIAVDNLLVELLGISNSTRRGVGERVNDMRTLIINFQRRAAEAAPVAAIQPPGVPKFFRGERIQVTNEHGHIYWGVISRAETRWSEDKKPYIYYRLRADGESTDTVVVESRVLSKPAAATAPAQPEAKGEPITMHDKLCDEFDELMAAPVPAAPADKGELSERLSQLGDKAHDESKITDNPYFEQRNRGRCDAYHHAAALARQAAAIAEPVSGAEAFTPFVMNMLNNLHGTAPIPADAPQPFAGIIVLLETMAEIGMTSKRDGKRTPNSELCLRFAVELRALVAKKGG